MQWFFRCFLAQVRVTRQINKFKPNLTKLSSIGHVRASLQNLKRGMLQLCQAINVFRIL